LWPGDENIMNASIAMRFYFSRVHPKVLDSEWGDECIEFTMTCFFMFLHSKKYSILNFEGGFGLGN
jgi:hypothetical protein